MRITQQINLDYPIFDVRKNQYYLNFRSHSKINRKCFKLNTKPNVISITESSANFICSSSLKLIMMK